MQKFCHFASKIIYKWPNEALEIPISLATSCRREFPLNSFKRSLNISNFLLISVSLFIPNSSYCSYLWNYNTYTPQCLANIICRIIIKLCNNNIFYPPSPLKSQKMKALIKSNEVKQKSGTLEQAGMRYGFGRNSMRKIAEDAGAIIKIGKSVRVNFTIVDRYLDSISGE